MGWLAEYWKWLTCTKMEWSLLQWIQISPCKKHIHLIKTYDWFYVQYLPSQVQLDAFPNVKPSFFTRIRPFFLRSTLFWNFNQMNQSIRTWNVLTPVHITQGPKTETVAATERLKCLIIYIYILCAIHPESIFRRVQFQQIRVESDWMMCTQIMKEAKRSYSWLGALQVRSDSHSCGCKVVEQVQIW